MSFSTSTSISLSPHLYFSSSLAHTFYPLLHTSISHNIYFFLPQHCLNTNLEVTQIVLYWDAELSLTFSNARAFKLICIREEVRQFHSEMVAGRPERFPDYSLGKYDRTAVVRERGDYNNQSARIVKVSLGIRPQKSSLYKYVLSFLNILFRPCSVDESFPP